MTPLHLAAEKGGRSDIIDYLVTKGADINIQDTHFGVSETDTPENSLILPI